MSTLEVLESVSRLSDYVVRILGQNPGKFTLQGTNTYLIGNRRPYTLIDTGEGKPEYIPFLKSHLQGTSGDADANLPHVSDVIISHWHPDHVGGLPSVLVLLRDLWAEGNKTIPFKAPRIHKYPLSSLPDDRLQQVVKSISADLYTPSPTGCLFHDLTDGQRLLVGSSQKAGLRVIHSPGHTEDSISLLLPFDNALYTADTVLGQGTAVFEDLSTYISTLRALLECDEYTVLYPGHGPAVKDGANLIRAYIEHRMERETQIVHLLQQPAPEGEDAWSTWGIVSKMYAEYPQNLWEPAARSVDQHLRKLERDGEVRKIGGQGKNTRWKLVART